MSLRIRDAVAADHPALVDLWQGAWAETLPQIDFAARCPWLAAHLAALAASGVTILVAEDGSGLAGFVTVDRTTRDLDQLAVAADRKRLGIGTSLIDAAKACSPGGLTLAVNVDNPRAVALYRRVGFTVTGTGISSRSGLPILFMAWSGR